MKRYSIITLWCLLFSCFYISTLCAQSKKVSNKFIEQISYRNQPVILNAKALYVDAKLKKYQLGEFAFLSLQDAVKYAKSGTEENPTVIYLAPDVYWTDDPQKENKENKLIGLLIPQSNITLIGLSENPEHTIIAGDRGQMAGAIGNWNTVGVGDGFKAYNITFGNYCNVDLIYVLDSTKNHSKRQKAITQAQVLTTAHRGSMDKWIFENCHFVSMLNTFAAGREPRRTYYKNCFFQCTDDAIGSGDLSVFDRCRFKFYSNHPSWGGSRIMQFYLGCDFESVLRDPNENATIYFAKNNSVFSVIDAKFTGNVKKLGWTDYPQDDVRHYVSNNSLNEQEVIISAQKPDLSVELNLKALRAFKLDNNYNIYNLLRGDDDWDPANQKEKMNEVKDLPFRLQLISSKNKLNGFAQEEIKVNYEIYPNRVREITPITWTVSDTSLLSFKINDDGSILLKSQNIIDQDQKAFIKAETKDGIVDLIIFDIKGTLQKAPVFVRKPKLSKPKNGVLIVEYSFDLNARADDSQINWYRVKKADRSDSIKVGVSRLNEPLKTWKLTTGDIGYYLMAKVSPKHSTSYIGKPEIVISEKIKATDVLGSSIETDFKNIPTERNSKIQSGFWTLDTYRPIDLDLKFPWIPGEGEAWTYGVGSAGTGGIFGLSTLERGARLLYTQSGSYKDMKLYLSISPQKASAQGFGSATGQYLDVYIKFDTETLSGYGLRIERTPKYAEAVKFTLYEYENGKGKPISEEIYSSVFVSGCKIQLSVEGDQLKAIVVNENPQPETKKMLGLVHEVSLSAKIQSNLYGGFGVQHTGSVGMGNRLMLQKIKVDYSN